MPQTLRESLSTDISGLPVASIQTCSQRSWSAISLTTTKVSRSNIYKHSRTSWLNVSVESKRKRSLRQKGSWDSCHRTLDPLDTYQATRAPGRNLSFKVTVHGREEYWSGCFDPVNTHQGMFNLRCRILSEGSTERLKNLRSNYDFFATKLGFTEEMNSQVTDFAGAPIRIRTWNLLNRNRRSAISATFYTTPHHW